MSTKNVRVMLMLAMFVAASGLAHAVSLSVSGPQMIANSNGEGGAPTTAAVNLTAAGTLDWLHLNGTTGVLPVVESKLGATGIGGPVPAAGWAFPNSPITWNWSDGTTAPSGPDMAGAHSFGSMSFSVAAPAGDARRLIVYGGYGNSWAAPRVELALGASTLNSERLWGTNLITGNPAKATALGYTSQYVWGEGMYVVAWTVDFAGGVGATTLTVNLQNNDVATQGWGTPYFFAATLQAVPEPASLGLLGLGALVLLRRRK